MSKILLFLAGLLFLVGGSIPAQAQSDSCKCPTLQRVFWYCNAAECPNQAVWIRQIVPNRFDSCFNIAEFPLICCGQRYEDLQYWFDCETNTASHIKTRKVGSRPPFIVMVPTCQGAYEIL